MGLYTDRGYTLEMAKNACASEIESWYGGHVLDVFDSNALGVTYRYYCSEADQLRMLNGKVANTSVQLMCGLVSQGDQPITFDWVMHTSAESGKVHTDYVQFSKFAATQYQFYKQQLNLADTVEEVDDIVLALWG